MKLAAATAVAECVSPVDLAPEYIGPRIFHLGGLRKVAEAVGKRGDSNWRRQEHRPTGRAYSTGRNASTHFREPQAFPIKAKSQRVITGLPAHLATIMFAYAGTYTADGEKVVHHVDISWNQSWTRTDPVRFYKLDGDTLTIRTARAESAFEGEEGEFVLVWNKIQEETTKRVYGATRPLNI